MKRTQERLWLSLVAGGLIHAVFCAQAAYAAQDHSGGLVGNDVVMRACLPHVFLMFFLPPTWPSSQLGDAYWWHVAGKLLVCFPASLLYGWIVGALWYGVRVLCRRGATGILKAEPR